MFDSKQTLTEQATDTVDLIIDFATLGEYGLEPAGHLPTPCEARRRPGSTRSTGAWNAAIERFATQS
jgi:hypothetical protein